MFLLVPPLSCTLFVLLKTFLYCTAVRTVASFRSLHAGLSQQKSRYNFKTVSEATKMSVGHTSFRKFRLFSAYNSFTNTTSAPFTYTSPVRMARAGAIHNFLFKIKQFRLSTFRILKCKLAETQRTQKQPSSRCRALRSYAQEVPHHLGDPNCPTLALILSLNIPFHILSPYTSSIYPYACIKVKGKLSPCLTD
jgi:hypothetical protein